MPNHVTNVIDAPKHVIDFLASEHAEVDFNKLIPMPNDDDPMFTATKSDFGNGVVGYAMDGYSPLDWNRQEWGTKWNAYSIERLSDTSIKFETAWSHPSPVILALSEKFPTELITVQYADEDLGSNLGEYGIQGGITRTWREFGDWNDEATMEFACQLVHGQSYEEYQKEWYGDEDED